MRSKRHTPDNRFTSALEAVGNLLLPELEALLRGGWSVALGAYTEIEHTAVSQKTGPFYRHFLPWRKSLVSVLAESYRKYFRLALAHPQQIGRDAHEWSWDQLQPAAGVAVERIRDWYILACDGENQFLQRIASTEFVPGQTVSVSIPTTIAPGLPPESWRAPAWLFQVSLAYVGIGPLKTKNIPEKNSEERLGPAHTRLLLKGAKRVFLWELEAEINTVRNEEIAAAGTIVLGTTVVEQAMGSTRHRSSKDQPKGTEGLGKKASDLSKYMDGLTEKQQLALSLRLEYRLPLKDVASRMGVNRKTAYEHFMAARRKIDQIRSNKARRPKNHVEE